jgi:sulfhydrogenase subunit alpha
MIKYKLFQVCSLKNLRKISLNGWSDEMTKEINLNHICKIEGHASLNLKIEKNKVVSCELKANEGARFFEALVINKKLKDIQEIVSRICGICSASHSVCSIQALEEAIGLKVTEQQKIIRELLMIGEIMRSHVTHLYFLALPDYLYVNSALELKKNHHDKINTSLSLINLGNKIIEIFGIRELHPFFSINQQLRNYDSNEILELLYKSNDKILETIELFSSFKYPVLERKTEFFCLKDKNNPSIISGRIFSKELKFNDDDYKKHLKENIKEYATSKFVLIDNKPYQLGAISRINNNYDSLDIETKTVVDKTLKHLGLSLPLNNPYYNNLCQAFELLQLKSRSIKLFKDLKEKYTPENSYEIKIQKGIGVSAVEAPRGTLFHEYEINDQGVITRCNIITPTAQNLNMMETDIILLVNSLLQKNTSRRIIIHEIEKLIRAYDPCFSCSTHFLEVKWL